MGEAIYLTPGLYRRIAHRFEFGIGTPLGISGRVGNVGLVAKMTMEIGGERKSGITLCPSTSP
jgi:hypothetical protein